MVRIARVVAPGTPHHVTQRGNRRQQTFFNEDDYRAYLDLMAEWCGRFGVEIWAYCLMPNHVHLIAVPKTVAALGQAVGEAHRRYSLRINFREGGRGHLWQGRFASFPMDDAYLLENRDSICFFVPWENRDSIHFFAAFPRIYFLNKEMYTVPVFRNIHLILDASGKFLWYSVRKGGVRHDHCRCV